MARTTAGEFFRRKLRQQVELSDQSSADLEELHVLAVDDSHVDRKVIERLLTISSCKVTAVESGRRALQYLGLDGEKSSVGFNGLKVNLIMTDYSMPGMTGYELLKKIKESSTFREIPVVIMSSENILARIDRCLEEGAEDYIVKPVKLSDVKRLKDYIIRGEGEENGEKGIHKRKLQVDYNVSSSPSPPLSSSPSLACDVKHLKDYIIRGEGEENGEKGIHRRKLQVDYNVSPPLSSSPSLACDLSTSPLPLPSSSPSSQQCPSKRPRLRNRD